MGWLHVRNWERFQHYKNRNPPWIKLHVSLLNDKEFCALDCASRGLLVQLWILASENDGKIKNDHTELSFRLRMDCVDINPLIEKGFLVRCKQQLSFATKCFSETEAETEAETDVTLSRRRLSQAKRRQIWFNSIQRFYPIGDNPQQPRNMMRVSIARREHGTALGEAKEVGGLSAEKEFQASLLRAVVVYANHEDVTGSNSRLVVGIGRWFEERTWERYQPAPQTDNKFLRSVLNG